MPSGAGPEGAGRSESEGEADEARWGERRRSAAAVTASTPHEALCRATTSLSRSCALSRRDDAAPSLGRRGAVPVG